MKKQLCNKHGYLDTKLNAIGVELYSYMSINKTNFEEFTIISNYPDEWKERYIHSRFQYIDPVITLANRSILPFGWGTYFTHPKSIDAPKKFIEYVHKFKLINGATFILHDQFNNLATLNICSNSPENLLVPNMSGILQMILIDFHQEMNQLNPAPLATVLTNQKSLTHRERQVLHLIKNGVKYWEISKLLSISVETVKYHRKNILIKLNVDNTKRAVLLATQNKIL